MQIKYVKGDATNPIGKDIRIIIHCCNDIGGWGKGFVIALSKKWKSPELSYRRWFTYGEHPLASGLFGLGEIQPVIVEHDIVVVNMIGQHGTISNSNPKPIRYDAINSCLNKVAITAQKYNDTCSVHAPRFGAGLAGGEWPKIELLIKQNLINKNIPVTIYDL